MKVLMFGWEFPPKISGGLGVACHGIVQSLLAQQIDITLVLPFSQDNMTLQEAHLQYLQALDQPTYYGEIKIELVNALLRPYFNAQQYASHKKNTKARLYGEDLLTEIKRYAEQAALIARKATYDVIHVHDWLTVLAGISAKKISGKPLVFHIHALEQDRSPNQQDNNACAIEKRGLEEADIVIAVSYYTKKRIIQEYQIPAEKIQVVYNGHPGAVLYDINDYSLPKENYKILFLGRVTEQKGPYYFIKAAEKILSLRRDIEFIIAGEGDQLPYVIETCARLGLASHVHFTGFLDQDEVRSFYQISDVYVMPSVSEPFGIVCLEAIANNLPVILSKQSGVAEVLTHALKVDFWDIDQLAENIMALVDYPALQKEMLPHAKRQLSALTWDVAAQKIITIYQQWM